jgi:hypothetical protein
MIANIEFAGFERERGKERGERERRRRERKWER